MVRNPHDSMALQRVINTPTRGIGKTTLETLEQLALETGQSTWDALGAAISNRLIPNRAIIAIESFRQLILDAQAMMDPDFAGKLSGDTAQDEDADTGFEYGAASTDSVSPDAASADSATNFDFGGNEHQIPLLDASNFSPFAAEPKRPFLTMPKTSNPGIRPGAPGLHSETWDFRAGRQFGSKSSLPHSRRRRYAARVDPFHHRPHRLH